MRVDSGQKFGLIQELGSRVQIIDVLELEGGCSAVGLGEKQRVPNFVGQIEKRQARRCTYRAENEGDSEKENGLTLMTRGV